LKIVVQVAWFASADVGLVRFDAAAEAIVLATSVGLIAAGRAWEALWQRVGAVGESLYNWRSLRRLYPLWEVLYEAVPHIALAAGESARGGVPAPRDVRLQLVRRVVEIRDGQLSLRRYADPRVRRAAEAAVTTAGLSGREAEAVVEACCLESARRAQLNGNEPVHRDTGFCPGGVALSEEVAWLELVATALDRSPIVTQVAREGCGRRAVEGRLA
jgi:hypothetical protein